MALLTLTHIHMHARGHGRNSQAPPLPPLPDILPLGLTYPHDGGGGIAAVGGGGGGVGAPYEAFPGWASVCSFLLGEGGRDPPRWDMRRPAALFEVVEVRWLVGW